MLRLLGTHPLGPNGLPARRGLRQPSKSLEPKRPPAPCFLALLWQGMPRLWGRRSLEECVACCPALASPGSSPPFRPTQRASGGCNWAPAEWLLYDFASCPGLSSLTSLCITGRCMGRVCLRRQNDDPQAAAAQTHPPTTRRRVPTDEHAMTRPPPNQPACCFVQEQESPARDNKTTERAPPTGWGTDMARFLRQVSPPSIQVSATCSPDVAAGLRCALKAE